MPLPATNIVARPNHQSTTSLEGVSDNDNESTSCTRVRRCDGGARGVVTTLASFLVHAMTSGFVKSLGVFFVNWQEVFEEGAVIVGWTTSVTACSMLMTGPLAAVFARRFGCRPVVIFGGILATSAVIAASRASSIYLLIGFMVLTGIGLGFTYQPSIIVISFNFERRLGCALGATFSGVGIGIVIFPPLMRVLIDEYGWQGAMLVLAAVLANLCVVGALYLPSAQEKMQLRRRQKTRQEYFRIKRPRGLQRKTASHQETRIRMEKIQVEENIGVNLSPNLCNQTTSNVEGQYCSTVCTKDKATMGTGRNVSSKNEKELRTVDLRERIQCAADSNESANNEIITFSSISIDLKENISSDKENHHVEEKGPGTYERAGKLGTCKHPPPCTKESNIVFADEMTPLEAHENQYLSLDSLGGLSRSQASKGCSCFCVLSYFIDTFHLDLLVTNFRFMALCLIALLHGLGYYAALVYTVSRAISIDIPKTEAALLASITGVGSFVGRLLHGTLIDTGIITPPRFLALALLVESVSCLLLPLSKSFSTMSIYAVVFGVSSGIASAVFPINVQRVVTASKAGNSIGLYIMFLGVGDALGVVVVGLLFDLTGSYDTSYWAAGVVNFVSCSIMTCEPLLKRLQDKFDRRRRGEHQEGIQEEVVDELT